MRFYDWQKEREAEEIAEEYVKYQYWLHEGKDGAPRFVRMADFDKYAKSKLDAIRLTKDNDFDPDAPYFTFDAYSYPNMISASAEEVSLEAKDDYSFAKYIEGKAK